MANKEKIDYLLLDLKELETLIAGMRDAEVYPVSFFSQTFNLTHKILNDLHSLETAQIEVLRKQMEAHQALIQSLPNPVAAPMPVPEVVEIQEEPKAEKPKVEEPVKEVIVEQPEIIIKEKETVQPEKTVEPEKPVEAPRKPVTAEKPGVFLNDLLEKKNLSDFRKAFSLNDRFRFRRELFGGDEDKMYKAVTDLNEINSYEESIAYLNNELKWNVEDEAVADFIKLLEKRFL
ncbi:hypothetical protein [Parabacteroides sp.]